MSNILRICNTEIKIELLLVVHLHTFLYKVSICLPLVLYGESIQPLQLVGHPGLGQAREGGPAEQEVSTVAPVEVGEHDPHSPAAAQPCISASHLEASPAAEPSPVLPGPPGGEEAPIDLRGHGAVPADSAALRERGQRGRVGRLALPHAPLAGGGCAGAGGAGGDEERQEAAEEDAHGDGVEQ